MTAPAGAALLWGALVLALAGTAGWARAARGGGQRWRRIGRRSVLLAWAWSAAAVLLMEIALVRRDTSLAYVPRVTDPDLPLYYAVTSLWAAMEGSLLLWLLAVATVAALSLPRRGLDPATHSWAAAVTAAVTAAFAAVALAAAPFAAASTASSQPAPSPLLQDHPAMGVHPPLLYAGFAALAVPFALSCAALAVRRVGSRWARVVRGWTLAAWLLLTVGIGIGAWWSYAVLGWGGYWAWDPVENASLLPWLFATALLHALPPQASRGTWQSWAPALAGGGFLLVLLATFLTRSGVVESVHAFAISPLGPLLLVVLLAATLPWLVLLVRFRLGSPTAAEQPPALLSRQGLLRVNGVLLVVITGTVLLGTVLPAVLFAVTGERLSVGPPWYARTVGPLALALLVLMALGPWVAPTGDLPRRLLVRVRWPAVTGAAVTGVLGLAVPDPWLAVVTGLATFVAATLVAAVATAPRHRRRIGALLAHTGLAVGAVAVVAGGHAATTQQTVAVGESVSAGATTATLVGVERHDQGRRLIAEARVLVSEADGRTRWMTPQLRWYPRQQTMLAGPQIQVEAGRDVYLTLLDVDPAAGTATLRLAVTPLATWLWLALAVMVAGGALAGWPRRHRTPAPELGVADVPAVAATGTLGVP